jgi:hypothetical protein
VDGGLIEMGVAADVVPVGVGIEHDAGQRGDCSDLGAQVSDAQAAIDEGCAFPPDD